jgi:UDP-glucose/iron transport system ATP-binding protein
MAIAASDEGAALIEAHQIGRRVPGTDKWLLRDVNLRLGPGARLAVVGASGSGKTLLLRALALLDPLDEGSIEWRGGPAGVKGGPEYRRQVMYLHQQPVLFEGNVEENLRQPFSLQIHGTASFDKQLVLELLTIFGRPPSFLKTHAGDLSGGERQIVALIRAIQLEPSVLLLDEPAAALDVKAKEAVERLLDGWLAGSAGDHALIHVSHDQSQATDKAQNVLRLENGRMLGSEPK